MVELHICLSYDNSRALRYIQFKIWNFFIDFVYFYYYIKYKHTLHEELFSFQKYNQAQTSKSSKILPKDINNQNFVDERFLEVIKRTDGTFRLRSVLQPGSYL